MDLERGQWHELRDNISRYSEYRHVERSADAVPRKVAEHLAQKET